MSHSKSSVLDSELFWESLTVGAFSLTILAYLRVGFVESFLPLAVGIYCLRRSFAVRVDGGRDSSPSERLADRYDLPEDGEWSDEKRLEILTDVRSDYRKKRRLWSVLSVLCVGLALVAIPVTVLVTVVGGVVAGYCLVQRRHANDIVRYLDRVLAELPE